jgi:hypothetical protein
MFHHHKEVFDYVFRLAKDSLCNNRKYDKSKKTLIFNKCLTLCQN